MSDKYERYFWGLVQSQNGHVVRDKKHIVIKFPNGKSKGLAKTPSDWRSWRRAIRDVKMLCGVTKTIFREGTATKRTTKPINQHEKPLLKGHTPIPKRPEPSQHGTDIDTGDRHFPANIYGTIGKTPKRSISPRGERIDKTIHKYSKEVLKHADFLLMHEGVTAMNDYLKAQRSTMPIESPNHRDNLAAAATGSAPIDQARRSIIDITKGPVEQQIDEARHKAIRLRQEAQRTLVEADQLEGFANKLAEAISILTGKAPVTHSTTPITLPNKGKRYTNRPGTYEQTIVEHLRSVGKPIPYPELRKFISSSFSGLSNAAVYGAIGTSLRTGAIVKIDNDLALPEWTDPQHHQANEQPAEKTH